MITKRKTSSKCTKGSKGENRRILSWNMRSPNMVELRDLGMSENRWFIVVLMDGNCSNKLYFGGYWIFLTLIDMPPWSPGWSLSPLVI